MPVIRYFLPAVLVCVSPVGAGVVITLEPQPGYLGQYWYGGGEVVRVEVFAQLDSNSPVSVRVRGMQFNISDSTPGLGITPVATHPDSRFGDGLFWDFKSSFVCSQYPEDCGEGYFTNSIYSTQNLSAVYWSPATSSSRMINLSQAAPTRVGVLDVTMPYFSGAFLLDLLNEDEAEYMNFGSWLVFGFGDESSDDPRTEWSAHNGSMTGGRVLFYVGVPEPATLALLLFGTACITTKSRNARRKSTS